ncbi:hypothetical protein MKL09_12170 [Methylobacterium sp. J-048]|uniref:hypothetical protein n=1 Tax=Methylobacterium sp. J-048 TaxID=2836635 RepID=UPI001FB9C07C|nr:hypothetical protein [Methylobacterium sp. J-048]MCJ2057310.1 hypothetical protein [Methylobacterium sp. J-048]
MSHTVCIEVELISATDRAVKVRPLSTPVLAHCPPGHWVDRESVQLDQIRIPDGLPKMAPKFVPGALSPSYPVLLATLPRGVADRFGWSA